VPLSAQALVSRALACGGQGCPKMDQLPSLMTEDQVARHFNFSTETLKRLIARGDFPEGLRASDQCRVWHKQDILWYEFGLCLRHRLVNKKAKAQQGTPTGQPDTTGESDENAP
jgi:hypothetical protein